MSKVALITGGGSGLGFQLARNLANKGYIPILVGRNKERLEKAKLEIENEGHQAVAMPCDITDEKGLKEIAGYIEKNYKKLDYLILNAGVVTCKLLEDYTDSSELKKDIDIDLWGTILCTYVFQPLLQKGSKVMMVSSGFGLMGPAGYTTYAASKAGVINFAESFKREVMHKGVSVYVPCPGDMDTPQFHEEHRSMPDWMKKGQESAPRGMMSPTIAAEKILKKCKGNKLIIIFNPEIKLLIFLTHILPKTWRDGIINKLFPLPS